MRILVTGAAGFIGFHTCKSLLERGDDVVGIDNLNHFYDVRLKEARLTLLKPYNRFRFIKADLADRANMERLFADERPQRVVHLGAQAGVRHSITHPHDYASSNMVGTLHVLEGCRNTGVEHLVFASSSSVYGANTVMPFNIHQTADHPLSLYGASKKANEMMAHTYAHLYGMPITGLRFFTVYGPWGRPDMAVFIFTQKILNGEPIDVFNEGRHSRDFTYIDDVVDAILRSCDRIATSNPAWTGANPDPATSSAPYRLYNIGNHSPVALMDFIDNIERVIGKPAIKNFLPMQPGDVPATYADINDAEADLGFRPKVTLEEGIHQFVSWYLKYYRK